MDELLICDKQLIKAAGGTAREQPGEADSFPNNGAKCQLGEVSSIPSFLDAFLFPNPGKMTVPLPGGF